MSTRISKLLPSLGFPAIFIAALLGQSSAVAVTVSIDARSNIFAAGLATVPAGDGLLPPSVLLGGSNQVVTFSSVTGLVDCVAISSPRFGPDGSNCTGPLGTFIFAANGISGIVHSSRQMFLTGVFLGANLPSDPPPPSLQFTGTSGSSFATLSPLLNQTFFIGDGLTGTGSGTTQQFYAPPGATRLYLGFADAFGFGTPGSVIGYPPSSYLDNSGFISATVTVSAVPEPAIAVTLVLGLALIARRKRASVPSKA